MTRERRYRAAGLDHWVPRDVPPYWSDPPVAANIPDQPWLLDEDDDLFRLETPSPAVNQLGSTTEDNDDPGEHCSGQSASDEIRENCLDESDIPSKVACEDVRKQDARRTGFFDLPAELRNEIYRLTSNRMHDEYVIREFLRDERRMAGDCSTALDWPHCLGNRSELTAYRASFIKMQLIHCRLRKEFLAIWTEHNHFRIDLDQLMVRTRYLNDPGFTHADLAHKIWIRIRDFLLFFDQRYGTANRIRNLEIVCWHAEHWTLDRPRRQFVLAYCGEGLARHLEDMDSDLSHNKLCLRVMIYCTTHKEHIDSTAPGTAARELALWLDIMESWRLEAYRRGRGSFHAAMRTFKFQRASQVAERVDQAVHARQAWVCVDDGVLDTRDIAKRWNFVWC